MRALIFIINTFAQLYLFVLLLRFWLPWLGASFSNPIAQGILRLTSPLVVPVRRIIPSIGRLDTATVLVALALQYLTILVILALMGSSAGIGPIALTAAIDLVMLTLRLFVFAIFIYIILRWVAPHVYNPATQLLETLVMPVLRPFRRVIPSIGGIDISPIFAIILIQAASIVLSDLRPIPI